VVQANGSIPLHTRSGDPYIQFPQRIATLFPNNQPSNIARLVAYDGKPAILVPAEHMGDTGETAGNLILTKLPQEIPVFEHPFTT
jgi:hypothetical protein